MTPPRPFALITGASSGIGLAIATQLAASHYNLILVARNNTALCALAEQLRSAHGVEVQVFAHDLSQSGAAQTLVQAIGDTLDRLEILVNNAGFGINGHFEKIPLEQTQSMMLLNMNTLAELTLLCLPGMLKNKKGQIINIASVAAFQACPNFAVYGASKAFVLSLSQALNIELAGTGVTITAVCPGATATNFHEVAGSTHSIGSKRMDSADKVAQLAIEAARAGKSCVITGATNKFIPWASRLLPRYAVAKIAQMLFKR